MQHTVQRGQEPGPGIKKRPIRTCLACNKRFPKNELVKFIYDRGMVKHDSKGTGKGRSAYCCDNKNCRRIFFGKKRKMQRAFRLQNDHISLELQDWE